jgi:flagellar assembly protein FliH
MSLSKYYKNSNSFQPVELIKREGTTSAGWQSSQQDGPQPFQSQQLPTASDPQKGIQTSSAPPDNSNTANNAVGSPQLQETIPNEDQHTAPPLEQDIDLSNYLELDTANEKIEAAYEKGLQAGTDKAKQDFLDATKALLRICQQLDAIRETIIGNSKEELQEFALSIAERILRFSVREQDNTIIATIEEALQRAVKSDEFILYINPEDYEIVAANSAEIIAGMTSLNKIVIKKDSTIERGGTKIESDNCTIDATIASQFDIIREEIKKNS